MSESCTVSGSIAICDSSRGSLEDLGSQAVKLPLFGTITKRHLDSGVHFTLIPNVPN
jgi:hypothetical protein